MARKLKKRLLNWFALHIGVRIGFWIFTVIGWTLRTQKSGYAERVIATLESGQRYVAAFWHGDIVMIALERRLVTRYGPLHIMTSQSRDGALMERFIEYCKMVPTRGSSSRGGARALLTMIRSMENKGFGGTAVDGPRGPRHRVNREGIVLLAQRTGLPILPLVCHAERKWVFGSWDRMELPKPFSRTIFHVGEPLIVPKDADANEIERMRQVLEDRMREPKEKDGF